jgi:CRISPR-associated protein Cmr3
MTFWTIEPRDPVIFGDGKPFSAVPGSRARSLGFPFPSTVAGAVRTRAGTDLATGQFDKAKGANLLNLEVRGPLLVQLNELGAGEAAALMFPAPADALLLPGEASAEAKVVRLQPLALAQGVRTDLRGTSNVGPTAPVKEKPLGSPPRFWNHAAFENWLEAPASGRVPLATLGHGGPARESRMHVSIDAETSSAREGALFQTSGLEFVHLASDGNLSSVAPLALALETDAPLVEGPGVLGGERRQVSWRKGAGRLPDCPRKVRDSVIRQGACRLILLTPAYFEAGYLPSWLLGSVPGVKVAVAAVALNRYSTVSGWDYATGLPKPTRRLAPPGSVYFLSLKGAGPDLERWIDAVWFRACSDGEQDRRDGFGLAALGSWEGVEATVQEVVP